LMSDGELQSGFSNREVSIRRYTAEEDTGWAFGARGDLEYDNGESLQEKNIVFWYTAHLPHHAALGPAAWLAVGPVLKVQR